MTTTKSISENRSGADQPGGQLRGIGIRAALAIGCALLANVILGWLATLIFDIPEAFPPLAGPAPAIFFTLVGMVGAVAVYALLRRVSAAPDRTFRRVALVVLLLSFIPDLMLLTEGAAEAVPGVTLAGVVTLMVMHVVAAVSAVHFLTGGLRR